MEHNEDIWTKNESNMLSTKCSVAGTAKHEINPVQDIVMDYTDVFTTHELFESREKLFDWVRDRGNEHGMVIVISKSDSGLGKKKVRLLLACERSGYYRGFKRKSSREDVLDENIEEQNVRTDKKKSSKRETGTKKCGCPFRLRGREISTDGEWALDVKSGVHNHPVTQYLEGHSYASRLSKAEEEYVMGMSMGNNRPKDILFGLRQKFADNKSTIRTIYNARMRNKATERGGQSQMQFLMGKLRKHGYLYHHRCCETSNMVKDIFFAHPTSIKLLRSFPKVLFMDCTYKTNRYKLPLLEIVGVTSTHMTFSVACTYLQFEREDNYIWACIILKSFMDPSCLPNVIITNREVALMNAIERTFPTSINFLCRWHINRNIAAHCKKMFHTKEKWTTFDLFWHLLVIADSESSFYGLPRRFQADFSDYPEAVQYVMDQWVGPYMERFVSCWTNKIIHFDNTTTNRTESHHASLKKQLGSRQGNFETCWTQSHTLLETSHNAIKHSFEKSKNVVQHKYKSIVFISLRSMVSIHAPNKIYEEMKCVNKGGVDPLLCGCVLRKMCGLPCAHEISEYVRLDKPIPLDQVDAFWRKLDMDPLKGDDVGVGAELESRWTECFGFVNNVFSQALESERLLMLKRLREIANPVTTSLIEPEIPARTHGRPKVAKAKQFKSTKRDPSKFEYVESIEDSCSPCEGVVYDVGPSSEPTLYTMTKRPKQKVVRKQTRLLTISGFIELLPSHFNSYIVGTKNVAGDGRCGFRAVANLLGYGEDSWGRVRGDLIHELITNQELYSHVFVEHDCVQKMNHILDCYTENALEEHWFCLPEMGYLVASAYKIALITLDRRMSLTFLPLRSEVPSNLKAIRIGLVNNNHFIEVMLHDGHPLPPVAASWTEFRHECVAGWQEFYQQQLDSYSESVGTNRVVRSFDTINLG